MSGKLYEFETLVRESHLDTFGHMNNAEYLVLFEQARWEVVTQGGYGLEKIKQTKQGPVVLEVNVKFSRELKLRETIRITTQVLEMSKISRLEQKIYNSSGEVAATALFVMGFFDTQTRKLIAPTPEWLKAVGWS